MKKSESCAKSLKAKTAVTNASIVVDLRKMQCGNLKVAMHDDFAEKCPICGAIFDRIESNHVALADKLCKKREEAGIRPED